MLRSALYFSIAIIASLLLASAGSPAARVGAAVPASTPLRWAYYDPGDPTSLASLRQRAGDLDYVGLHWASMRDDGSVEMKASPEVISLVRAIGARPLLSVALGNGGADTARALLATEDSRAAAVSSLATVLGDYDGISIDFEGLYPEDRDSLTRFMAQLAARLRPVGKLVTMALPAKTSDTRTGWAGATDYAGLAPHADLFVVMAYGFRTARSTVPGSVAPISWVSASMAFAASQIPPEKLLLGVAFYGYDWDTTSGPPARALRYPETLALAQQYGATIRLDPTQQSSTFSYTRDGHTHELWFEDRASLGPKLAMIAQLRLAGVAGWRLGHEDPLVWPAINALRQPSVPQPTAAPQPTPTPVPPAGNSGNPGGAAAQSGSRSWYFAEGSTAPPFDSWILLQNPNSVPATARLTFMPEGRPPIVHEVLIGPTSRTSVFANQLVPNTAFSTRIDSSLPLLAERAMYAGFDGHVVTAVTAPSRSWYLAEGATTQPFHTWILLQNPNSVPAYVRVNYLLESGAPLLREMLLPPNSRSSIFANDVIPNAAFSTRIESDQPIIAERAMYRFPGNAATGVTGVASPARNWFFAAGLPTYRNVPVDSWLLLQNPGTNPVTATITLYSTDGHTVTHQQYLPPTSRQSLFLNQIFQAGSFGVKVEATGDIIAERSVFIAPSAFSGGEPQGAYASQGATEMGRVWALAEGSTAPPFSGKISVLNPHNSPMQIRFELMLENGQVVTHDTTLEANRSLDLEMDSVVRSGSFSARVSTSLPSVVERTMFWAKGGKTGVHNTIGVRIE